nr:hypothetical protein [Tanacetum cinerariifolium]
MLFTMHETYVYRDPKAIIHFFMRPAAIIDRQLPFEYTITSRSTDVVVPIPPAPAADFATNVQAEWNALYDTHNKVACLMLGNQLERLGYVLPQDLTVGLILNGFTKDFARFVRNYNMHNMGKTIDELHAMLIEYKKGLPKRAETPQPKNPKPAAKEHPAKDNTCHHYKEVGHYKRNRPAYLAELIKKKKQVGTGKSATCILNMVPTKKVDKTPYELWYGKVPNLSYLKVWGCYPKETMGYYFYFSPENKIVVARYAEFFERKLITQEVSGRAIDLEEIQD